MRNLVVVILVVLTSLGLLVGCGGSTSGLTETNSPVNLEPVLLDSHLSLSGYGGKRIYGDYWSAQVITPLADWEVRSVKLRLWVEGLVRNFRVELVGVEDGLFGAILDSQIVETSSLLVEDPGSWVEVPLSSNLVAGREYAIVVRPDEGGEGDEFTTVRWVFDTGGAGGAFYTHNGGVGWYQVVDRDFLFEVWGVR